MAIQQIYQFQFEFRLDQYLARQGGHGEYYLRCSPEHDFGRQNMSFGRQNMSFVPQNLHPCPRTSPLNGESACPKTRECPLKFARRVGPLNWASRNPTTVLRSTCAAAWLPSMSEHAGVFPAD